jgi:peptide chain release factor 1
MAELSEQVKEKVASKLAEMASRHAELERKLADATFAPNTAQYAAVVREHGQLTKAVQLHKRLDEARKRRADAAELLTSEDADLRQLAKEDIAEAERAENEILKEALDWLLIDTEDEGRNVIMEIRAGTGGDEAALFAGDLFRMYSRYAQKAGWRIEVLDQSPGEMGGFKEIIFSVNGPDAWRKLRFESGGHRVQRVPATESQGRIHTSLATVAVLPEAEEVDVELNPEDLEITAMRSQGPGGQNVNKVASCIRIVHKPTGIAVKCEEQRSQHQNRRLAMKILLARLLEMKRAQQKAERDNMRRSQVGSGDRNERIRTYNFPQDRVTDHRIGLTVHGIQNIILGDCDKIFDALAEWDRAERVAALTRT